MSESSEVRRKVKRLFWLALALRVVIAVAIHSFLPHNTFAPDQMTYHDFGRFIAKSWEYGYGNTGNWAERADPKGYYYIVASLYYVFGPYSLLPKLLNAVVGALAIPVVFDLTHRMGGSVGGGPESRLLRQLVPVAGPLVGPQHPRRLDRPPDPAHLPGGPRPPEPAERLLPGPAGGRHPGAGAVPGLSSSSPSPAPWWSRSSCSAAATLAETSSSGRWRHAAMIYADQVAGGENRKARLIDLEELNEIRYWNTVGAASQFEQVDISTPGKACCIFRRASRSSCWRPSPGSWEVSGRSWRLPETLFFYWLIPWMLRGIRHLVRHHLRTSLMALLITAGLTFGYSLGEGNAGTAYRHRAQLLCFFLIFAAVGLEDARRRVRTEARTVSAPPADGLRTAPRGRADRRPPASAFRCGSSPRRTQRGGCPSAGPRAVWSSRATPTPPRRPVGGADALEYSGGLASPRGSPGLTRFEGVCSCRDLEPLASERPGQRRGARQRGTADHAGTSATVRSDGRERSTDGRQKSEEQGVRWDTQVEVHEAVDTEGDQPSRRALDGRCPLSRVASLRRPSQIDRASATIAAQASPSPIRPASASSSR